MEGHVDEKKIEQVVAGEAPPEVQQHVLLCPTCRQRVVELAREESLFMRLLLRAVCPDSVELGEWLAGLLPAERAEDVRRHVDECPHCREEVALLQEMLAAPSHEPSLSVAARKVQRLVARLLPPSSLSAELPQAFALRGAPAKGWQYQAGNLLITLDMERTAPADYTLFGLIVSDVEEIGRFEGTLVRLKNKDGAEISTARIDDLDTFAFTSVTPGTYILEIEAEGNLVVIENVNVGNIHVH